MKTRFTRSAILTALGITTLASAALAGPLETVGPVGSGATHTTILDAINAVDDLGVVEIIDAGTTNTVSGFIELSDGPANFTIRKDPSILTDVFVTGTSGSGGVMAVRNLTSDLDVTIEGVIMTRIGGSGPVIDIDQQDAFTIDLTFNDCTIQHTGVPIDENGEAVKFDDDAPSADTNSTNGGAAVTFTANNTNFTNDGDASESKAAIRVQDNFWQNLTVNLTDCTVSSVNYRGIRNDGGSTQAWNLLRTNITAANEVAFQFDDPHSDCTISIVDSTLSGGQEAIKDDESGSSNNSWTISGSTLTSTGTSDNTIRITYDDDFSEFNLSNSVIEVIESASTSSSRGVNLDGFTAGGTGTQGIFIYNNTFVGLGTGAQRVLSGSGMQINAWNNLCLNFVDAAGPLSGSFSGTGYESDNNIVVGPVDDSSRGTNGAYVVAAAGLANALTAAGLDGAYKPLAGSAVLGAGGTTNVSNVPANNDIVAFIGGVDKDGVTRETPPDVGAFELVTGSSINDWTNY